MFLLSTRYSLNSNSQSGQLLLEIMVAIAASVIIVTLGAQLVYVGMRGNKSSSETNVALGLVEETFEAARNIATEKWQNIYNLTKFSVNYYPQVSSSKWIAAIGTEDVIISNKTYTRYFIIQNVCRNSGNVSGITDSNGSAITCVSSGGVFDPSTQKITTNVNWPDAEALLVGEYITRWKNKTCVQTDWSGGQSGVVTNCPTTVYGSNDGNVDLSGGAIKLLTQ